jgi:uncharacterized surface protein with fasciclin (FAS1) repeats
MHYLTNMVKNKTSIIMNIRFVITRLFIIPALCILFFTCKEEELYISYYPEQKFTVNSYIEANLDSFANYYKLLQAGDLTGALSAYNPYGNNFTLFLPTDRAFEKFFNDHPDYRNIDDLIADKEYAAILTKYHIVNSAFQTSDFPFGALPDTTATGNQLIIAIDSLSISPVINGEAFIIKPDIEVLNGFIHVIDKVLVPITFQIAQWVEQRQDRFSIFYDALEVTGLDGLLANDGRFTLLLESNQVYHKRGIHSVEDLKELYSPLNSDYTSDDNGLYRFVAYHILDDIYYLDDFEGSNFNYNTYSIFPVKVDGLGLNIRINQGVGILDTLINGIDTTFINYLGFQYDQSNNQANNGSIHLIDQVMELYLPGRTIVNNRFHDEPAIRRIRNEPVVKDFTANDNLEFISWTGPEILSYVKTAENISGVWNDDYIRIAGNFTLRYEIPRLLPGRYNFFVAAHANNIENAMITIRLNGNPVGGNIDLSTGGTSNVPFYRFPIGTVELTEYKTHTIEVRTIIPGRFLCDMFVFEPI